MLISQTIKDPRAYIPTIAPYVRIRDRIVIDQAFVTKLQGDDRAPVMYLMAREIDHKADAPLVLHGTTLVVIADRYDGHGAVIDVSGTAGATGQAGANGAPGVAFANTRVNGGPGGAGAPGTPGMPGGAIHLICQGLGEVHVRANGGAGGNGGDGGAGGNGGRERVIRKLGEVLELANGGPGGAAGNGASGGAGGQIEVVFTAAGVPASPPLLSSTGGSSGAPGHRGSGGTPSQEPVPNGANGHAGERGKDGFTDSEPRGRTAYWTRVIALLGRGHASEWAAHRVKVGAYLYRRYRPRDPSRSDFLRRAVIEFESALQLDPSNAGAARYLRQIELGQNVLSYSENLDLIPDFNYFLAQYTSSVSLVTQFYQQGLRELLDAGSKADKAHELEAQVRALAGAAMRDEQDIQAARSGQEAAKNVMDDARRKVEALNERIRIAVARKPDDNISIGTIVSTVSLVATSVAAVAAAVPTAGTSLFALVPSLAGLGVQLTEIGGHLFDATKAEKDALKSQYDKVGKNVDDVVKGVKATINLASALEKLAASKTTDNAEVVGLMKEAVQLSFELLIAKLRHEQVQHTLAARQIDKETDTAFGLALATLKSQLTNDAAVLRRAGLAAIHATQRTADFMLEVAFRARRSVEIYTHRDASDRVAFDSGFVAPDLERDFLEMELDIATFVAAYQTSWLQFIEPLLLIQDFDRYFASDGAFTLGSGVIGIRLDDAAPLDDFRRTASIAFPIDFSHLPDGLVELSIQDVHVAFVGATSNTGVTNCRVRHGNFYRMLGRDGVVINQQLEPQVTLKASGFTPLNVLGLPPTVGVAARTHFDMPIWGRGAVGSWEIALNPNDIINEQIVLDGLQRIELWIAFQGFVRHA